MSITIQRPRLSDQQKSEIRKSIIRKLLSERITVTDLAKRIGYSRVGTSMAIHHGQNRGILIAIESELNLTFDIEL